VLQSVVSCMSSTILCTRSASQAAGTCVDSTGSNRPRWAAVADGHARAAAQAAGYTRQAWAEVRRSGSVGGQGCCPAEVAEPRALVTVHALTGQAPTGGAVLAYKVTGIRVRFHVSVPPVLAVERAQKQRAIEAEYAVEQRANPPGGDQAPLVITTGDGAHLTWPRYWQRVASR
jgi:hypothetical protein